MKDLHLSAHAVICFGEILWDFLPTGPVPGGAPMNVAYHLNKLGTKAALISRVGNDQWGRSLTSILQTSNISSDLVQVDDDLPTGRVNATLGEHNEVSYEILGPVAWDNIAWEQELADAVAAARYFVFGSLASRMETSRNTLFKLLEAATYKVVDINLRSPHFSPALVQSLLGQADFVKLNQAELELITSWLGNYRLDADRIKAIQDTFNVERIVVTLGGEGAIFQADGHAYTHPGFKVKVADTVGSGDAFLASLLHHLLNGAGPAEALRSACALGAFIAGRTGPCPPYEVREMQELMNGH
jgi:fructokinase